MDFPPTDWEVFPEEDFELAVPRDPGHLGAELMAQARGNGRIQDPVRLVLGGDRLIEKLIPVSTLINKATVPAWRLKISTWPRDIAIRRNMATSPWEDLRALVASGEVNICDADGREVNSDEFEDAWDQGSSRGSKGKDSAALRWAVMVGEDHRLHLGLQALPVAVANINSRPLLKG